MQQIPFIDLFKSALHISGDKLAHPTGALFNCIYSFWYNTPILLPTGDKAEMGLVLMMHGLTNIKDTAIYRELRFTSFSLKMEGIYLSETYENHIQCYRMSQIAILKCSGVPRGFVWGGG